ncbi:putative N-acetyltransferase YhbS [Evansella vedderi]|uniref:N-acetyltransferase YhbS n=1 Tax=Evansella vedderi TaxID=38282 RepID=A0ABT9ZNI3_9BACI|nr:hypothetical protein [Evansella vedderi]MDQ0252772.1 putative N-acetyltransferase YhbS [Evansella vedderi]
MNITIRKEQGKDYTLQCAFADAEYSDKKEHPLVDRMRKSAAFIPKLSLVAIKKDDDQIDFNKN